VFSRELTQSIAMAVIPYKGPATVVLNANTASSATVTIANAWLKQSAGGMGRFGGVSVEQAKTTINFFDSELNPNGDGRNIRAEDEITFGGVVYVVTDGGGALVSNRTTWRCSVQKKIQ
jgi:hypothetical protein